MINILVWVTAGSFSFCSILVFPSMTFLTRAIVLTEVPIDKETNNPFSGMIISSSNCSLHCVNISRYKLARINFFVATKNFFLSQVALKLESAKQPKQVLKMEVSVVKIIFGFVSSAVHIMFIKIIFTILKIIFRYVSSVVHIIVAVNSKIFSRLTKSS